jgi:hypothetical protein
VTAPDCSACFGTGWVHAGKSEPERCRLCTTELDVPALTGQQIEILGQVLADAIAWREPAGQCADCDVSPAGLCQDHAEDLDRCDSYGLLARALGVEL